MQEEAAPTGEAAEPEPDAEPDEKAEAKAAVDDEKKALKEKIAALEKELVTARGTLLAQQDAVKDAGEGGYLLLAANFERFRQKSRAELTNQESVGRVKAAGYLMSFADAFDELQASAEGSSEEAQKIHKYYAGIHKQFRTLLDQWEVASFEPVVGEMSDFSKHVTVERKESDEPAGTILEARTKGYTLAGATVRSAECVVSSGPAKAAEEEVPATEEAAADGEEAADAGEAPAE